MAKQRRRPQTPAQELDSPWKEALQQFLQPFLAFFFPALHAAIDWRRGYQALDKEFQQIIRDAATGTVLADKLFRVWRKDGRETWLLIHIEIQGQVDATFAERMFRYNIRAWERYQRTVVSLALLCADRPDWRPERFAYGDWGSETSLRFLTVKLLDYAGNEEALAEHANPMAAIVRAHLKAQATRDDPAGRYQWKTQLVRGLYERGWKAAEVRQLFRLIDWLMVLPGELQERFREELHAFEQEKRMPYVTSIERQAHEEGRQEGRVEGLRLGIEVALVCKFGEEGRKLVPKLQTLDDAAKLEALARALESAASAAALRRFFR
jgi:hypothetical protein